MNLIEFLTSLAAAASLWSIWVTLSAAKECLTKASSDLAQERITLAIDNTGRKRIGTLLLAILWMVSLGGGFLPYPILGAILLGACLLTLLFASGCRVRGKETLNKLLVHNSLAVWKISTVPDHTLWLWIKKSPTGWPPICLQGGITTPDNHWAVAMIEAPDIFKELLEKETQKTGFLQNSQLRYEMAQILKQNGASHPVDIEGADSCRTLLEFFQDILINPKAPQNT